MVPRGESLGYARSAWIAADGLSAVGFINVICLSPPSVGLQIFWVSPQRNIQPICRLSLLRTSSLFLQFVLLNGTLQRIQ